MDINIAEELSKLSKIFERKEKVSLGVDIGTSSLKIVLLEKENNKIILKNFIYLKTSQPLIKTGTPGLINPQAGIILADILKKNGIRQRKVNISVPGFSSLLTMIDLPMVEESQIDSMINVEAPKYIPIPLKDVVYGWQVIPEMKTADKSVQTDDVGGVKKTRVMLVALMKEVSRRYEESFAKAGLEIGYLEVDCFSIKRSLIGSGQGNYLILDIGEKVSNIIISLAGNIVTSRNIDVAGSRITEVIARSMNVSTQKAEQLKIKSGLDLDSRFGSSLVGSTVSSITTEVKRALDAFQKLYPEESLDEIFLSGGSASLKGLDFLLENELKIKVTKANPWSKVNYPPELENSLFENRVLFSAAVGSALVSLEENN